MEWNKNDEFMSERAENDGMTWECYWVQPSKAKFIQVQQSTAKNSKGQPSTTKYNQVQLSRAWYSKYSQVQPGTA